MPLTYLVSSRAVIWASKTPYATLFFNATVDDPENPKVHGTLVTEEQLTEFATTFPPAIASPSANVLRLYFDYDTGKKREEEIMAKLTCITSLDKKVLNRLLSMAQRYLFLTRR